MSNLENQPTLKSPEKQRKLTSKFEILAWANMPNWINRYRIINYWENWITDIVWNFFECVYWKFDFKLTNWESINDYWVWGKWKNKLALIMPLPFANEKWTEWIIISNWKRSWELINYWWDNALIWFKDWKVGIIKVNIWSNSKYKTHENNWEITAYNSQDQKVLDEILKHWNWYTVCQQISILNNWEKSAEFVWQTKDSKEKWRRYRFFVETNKWTFWVIDFKEEITIDEAIGIMKKNWIKNAVYADIISYQIFFWDKDWNFYTREEWNTWESEYKKFNQANLSLPNKNSIVMLGE